MISWWPFRPRGKPQQPVSSSLSDRKKNIHTIIRYGLAFVSTFAGLLLRFSLESIFGTGLATYVIFYPFLMLTALLGGFGPGLTATILTLFAIDIWIFPPVGQLTLTVPSVINVAGFLLFGLMGLFICLVAELYRNNRKKAAAYDREQALRETLKEKEFLADLLNNAEQPFAMSSIDGDILRFNRAFETLTGYSGQELPSLNWTRLTPEEWLEPEQHILDKIKMTGKPFRYEKEYIRKNGSKIPVEVLTHIGKEADSGTQYYYVFVTDLTKRKKTEAELREVNEQLRQNASSMMSINNELRESRLAALNLAEDADIARKEAEESSRNLLVEIAERKQTEEKLRTTANELSSSNRDLESFSYSVSHDLRNPLHTIGSFAEFLMEDYSDRLDEEGQDYIKRINEGVKKMQSLIDDMLRLSRIGRQEMNREEIDLSAIVHNYLQELKGMQPERNVEFVIQENIHADADPQLIHLAFENLLRNAWKFTSKKEKARIEFGAVPSTSLRHRTSDAQWPSEAKTRTVYFIRDNGAGFDANFSRKIFEPFKRLHADKEFGGTGVGLSIVQRVIDRHGGYVWAEGEVGKGATFYFILG